MAGSPICALVQEERREDEGFPAFAERFRPSPVSAARVLGAAMVVTASPAHRAALARLAPEARGRTFTLREALWLGRGWTGSPNERGRLVVEAFARYADSRRGAVLPPLERRWPGTGRTASDPYAIRDGHRLGGRAHAATLERVRTDAHALTQLLRAGRPD